MKHRGFVVTSTVILFVVAGVVAGLAIYSTVSVRASMPGLPASLAYLPSDSQAVFGMNVQRFLESPFYARLQEKHGDQIGNDLAEFIDKTGVDPRKDIRYIVAAGRPDGENKAKGVIIAEGKFNSGAITAFINTKVKPIELKYGDALVLMVPEQDGTKVEKGIAFLGENEIALGELSALKDVIDVKNNKDGKTGILAPGPLSDIIRTLNPDEMFWFAGDGASILAKAPKNTPLGNNISAITQVYGTLNLTTEVAGVITVTANNKENATKLSQVAMGLVALGSLASDQNPDLAGLMQGIKIVPSETQIKIKINFPIDLLEKLEQAKPAAAMKKVA